MASDRKGDQGSDYFGLMADSKAGRPKESPKEEYGLFASKEEQAKPEYGLFTSKEEQTREDYGLFADAKSSPTSGLVKDGGGVGAGGWRDEDDPPVSAKWRSGGVSAAGLLDNLRWGIYYRLLESSKSVMGNTVIRGDDGCTSSMRNDF